MIHAVTLSHKDKRFKIRKIEEMDQWTRTKEHYHMHFDFFLFNDNDITLPENLICTPENTLIWSDNLDGARAGRLFRERTEDVVWCEFAIINGFIVVNYRCSRNVQLYTAFSQITELSIRHQTCLVICFAQYFLSPGEPVWVIIWWLSFSIILIVNRSFSDLLNCKYF